MFKKFLLFLVLGLSCHLLLPVKIQTGSHNVNHEFIADNGKFEMSATELSQLKSVLIDGIIEDTALGDWPAIQLPINKQTFALLARMLDNTSVFNPERAESILRESTVTEFLPLLHALCFLNTTNTELYRVVAEHYLAIQSQITFENFVQHAQYITLFFQQDCVKELLAQAVAPYTCLQIFMGDAIWDTMALSPDGTKLATGSDDRTAILWDINSGKCIQTFNGHAGSVRSVVFSPDGTKLTTGSYDRTARLWDINTGECIQTFNGHAGCVKSVAFSPDGTKLATGSYDETARLWEVSTGECLQTFNGHAGSVRSVAFSPDNTKIATGSRDKTAKLWDVDTGRCVQTFTGHTDWVYSIAFSPDGTKLATGSADKTARLWDVNTGQCIHTFIGHKDWVRSIAFSPDGTKLATGSDDCTARLWDVNSGQCLQTFTGHTNLIRSIAFSPDGTKLATGSYDKTARLWTILDIAQQVLLVWAMKNTGKFRLERSPFLDEVYTSLPEQLQQKIITAKRSACSVM